MSNSKTFLSKILPSHADYKPILDALREKYGIPHLVTADKELADYLHSDQEIPWSGVKAELKKSLESLPELWPESVLRLKNFVEENPQVSENLDAFALTVELNQDDISKLTKGILNLILPLIQKFEEMLDTTTNLLLAYLATGETSEIPADWIGSVRTISMFGEPAVIAIAGQLSNPKEINEQFMAEYHRVFGKSRPKITEGLLNAADFLRMKLEGVRIKDIADVYIERYPSEFPKDPLVKNYRAKKRKLEERLKKRLQRDEKTLLKLIGDNSDP